MADQKPLRGWVDFPQYTRHSIPLFLVREQLALHGLHVVTAADKAALERLRREERERAGDPEQDAPAISEPEDEGSNNAP